MSWRLSYVDLEGIWGWRGLADKHTDELLRKLAEVEKLTLGELLRRPGTKNVPLASLSRPAQKRLEEIGRDDLDDLWELRFTGRQRVWGVVDGAIFYFLWWDPEHTVCPSVKKHT